MLPADACLARHDRAHYPGQIIGNAQTGSKLPRGLHQIACRALRFELSRRNHFCDGQFFAPGDQPGFESTQRLFRANVVESGQHQSQSGQSKN